MKPSNKERLINVSDNETKLAFEKQSLLKDLLTQISDSTPCKLLKLTEQEQMLNEVIFESDVDGVRYYLVRSIPKSQEKVSLSPREQAIAQLVAQGLPNKLIGIRLHISPWTVATHIRRIFVKLGVTSRTAMIAQLLKGNLLQE
ncbi:response regulator transcription factor [Aliinostoc sp. HNIBRCY26]|uniref:response regulator transcription factor n=1 Tax=Aliinostoc sp. HNIBRCY26 TaxID=3418997 RepID=UPI003D04094F